MSEEKIKQLMKEEMLKTIKNDLHSEMIFVYVDNLEKENKRLKDKIEKLKDYGEKVGERRNQLYDKIDKAIEYIKTKDLLNERNFMETGIDLLFKELLEILGDKE